MAGSNETFFESLEVALLAVLQEKRQDLAVLLWQLFSKVHAAYPNQVNINARDDKGVSLLTHAVICHSEGCLPAAVVKAMLEQGALADIPNKQGYMALHRAAAQDDIEMIDLLVQHDASFTHKTDDGETALDIAIKKLVAHQKNQAFVDQTLSSLLDIISKHTADGCILRKYYDALLVDIKKLLEYCLPQYRQAIQQYMPPDFISLENNRFWSLQNAERLLTLLQESIAATEKHYKQTLDRLFFYGAGIGAELPKEITRLRSVFHNKL